MDEGHASFQKESWIDDLLGVGSVGGFLVVVCCFVGWLVCLFFPLATFLKIFFKMFVYLLTELIFKKYLI